MTYQKLYNMDVLEALKLMEDESIDMVMTSPPYWGLRDYGVEGQIGLEDHPIKFIEKMVEVFSIIRKKLKKTGSVYLNLGDTYFGSWGNTSREQKRDEPIGRPPQSFSQKDNWLQPKQLLGMPWRVAIAMQNDGWILRNDIIWQKPNPMPSSVKDRLNNTFEHIFHLVKSRKYYYDLDVIREKSTNFNPAGKGDKTKQNLMGGMPAHQHLLQNSLSGKNPGDIYEYTGKADPTDKSLGQGSQIRGEVGKNPDKSLGLRGSHNPCDFWSITTQPFPEAHFAVYPEAICIKPIKSSCPKEICNECGFIRERIVEREVNFESGSGKSGKEPKGKYEGSPQTKSTYDIRMGPVISTTTKGFTKCSCNVEFHPGTVLDPFVGSGTTMKVARDLGRSSIGIEINHEYVEIIKRRMGWDHQTLVKNWEIIKVKQ